LAVSEKANKEVVIPGSRANSWSFIVFVMAAVIIGGPFAAIYGFSALKDGFVSFLTDYIVLALTLLVGITLHEFLHAVGFSFASERGWKSVNFGFSFKDFAPYTHCDEVVSYVGFAITTLLPGILLGVGPLLTSLITGNAWLLSFGLFFTAGAAGDFLCFIRLTKYPRDSVVKDHPDSIGFILMERN
jgi:hypothetical protein